jgi:hypothetical protein
MMHFPRVFIVESGVCNLHRASRDIVYQPVRLQVAGVHNYVNVVYGTFEPFNF